jgi:hypothetical protein
MPHQAAPTSDKVLLVYLLSVLLFMATAGVIAYRITRPTVLPNAGVAAFEREKRVRVILPSTSWQDVEESAVEVAARENEEQGLLPLSVADQTQPYTRPTPQAATRSTPKAANVAAARPPKTKRVAKVQNRNSIPERRDAWAYAPQGRPFAPVGESGSWFR